MHTAVNSGGRGSLRQCSSSRILRDTDARAHALANDRHCWQSAARDGRGRRCWLAAAALLQSPAPLLLLLTAAALAPSCLMAPASTLTASTLTARPPHHSVQPSVLARRGAVLCAWVAQQRRGAAPGCQQLCGGRAGSRGSQQARPVAGKGQRLAVARWPHVEPTGGQDELLEALQVVLCVCVCVCVEQQAGAPGSDCISSSTLPRARGACALRDRDAASCSPDSPPRASPPHPTGAPASGHTPGAAWGQSGLQAARGGPRMRRQCDVGPLAAETRQQARR
jgi:hypothetical protein